MRKIGILLFIAVLCAGCDSKGEKQAAERLLKARQAFEQGAFNEAKSELDSIKILFPRAVQARKDGIRLLQELELVEQQQTLSYLDSLHAEKLAEFETIKGKFILEKDTAYQEIGNYVWPTQVIEKNLHRSFLRFQVSEQGVLTMTSIYCGASFIHHVAIKVSAPDGTFAETPASKDSYETTDLGEKIEKADFIIEQDGNVMGFIYLNNDKNIRVDYLGERKYTTTMSATDRLALKETYELAQVLSTLKQIEKEQEEARLHIRFTLRKMDDSEAKTQAEQ